MYVPKARLHLPTIASAKYALACMYPQAILTLQIIHLLYPLGIYHIKVLHLRNIGLAVIVSNCRYRPDMQQHARCMSGL